MRKNFDMDAAIRRALRESIEAHAHEWEPKFNTGVGPVGDDAPFDKKASGDVNEGKDCEDCCPKCGKCPCECDKVNEGTIPGDSHEWEPGFETGVGEIGDDSPFTKAVNESLTDTNDWEDGSFGAGDHRKEGIAFADGGDECGNGVVATKQKNSGRVESSDNLNESDDESTMGQFIKNGWNGLKRRWNQAKEQDMANKGWVRADSVNSGNGGNTGTGASTAQAAPQGSEAPAQGSAPAAQGQASPQGSEAPAQGQENPQGVGGGSNNNNATDTSVPKPTNDNGAQNAPAGGITPEKEKNIENVVKQDLAQDQKINAQTIANAFSSIMTGNEIKQNQQAFQTLAAEINKPRQISNDEWKQMLQNSGIRTQSKQFGIASSSILRSINSSLNGKTTARFGESKEEKRDVIAEERDRFFDIINRIEKLYD